MYQNKRGINNNIEIKGEIMITLVGYPNSDNAIVGSFDYGQLRNVTSPGAGDGSPWRKQWDWLLFDTKNIIMNVNFFNY